MVNIAETQRKAPDMTNVYIVAVAVAKPVVGEFGMFDGNVAARIGVGENAVPISVKEAVSQREARGFETKACPVSIGDPGAGEFDAFDRSAIALDHPAAFLHGVRAVRPEMGATTNTANVRLCCFQIAASPA